MRTHLLLLMFLTCEMATFPAAQDLRDLARSQGGKASSTIDVEYPLRNPAELMAQADLVLQAKVVAITTRLSPDGTYVATDSVLSPLNVLKQRRSQVTAKPGQTTTIIVRRPGGRLVEAGLEMTTSVSDYPEAESLAVGDNVIAFLIYDDTSTVFNFVDGPYGVFRVQGGLVKPLTERVAKRRGHWEPVPVATFVTELNRPAR